MSNKNVLCAILGAGRQGKAAAYDLQKSGYSIIIADGNREALEECADFLKLDEDQLYEVDFSSKQDIFPLLMKADAAVFAADYALNLQLTKWAIKAKCHTIDYGGNHDVVNAQHEYQKDAEEADVAIIPDTGLTPGLAGILVAGGINKLQVAREAYIRVGGLPQEPKPPLNYSLLFSVRGLINEYVEPSVIMTDGKVETRPGLSGLESLEFDGKTYEAFLTSGGVSTLPHSFGDVLTELDCKTIRFPGHCEFMNTAMALGLMDQDLVEIDGQSINPRQVFEEMLVRSLPHDEPDVTLMRVTVKGLVLQKPARAVYEMIDKYDPETGFTSMQRTTAWPGTQILQMVLEDQIEERGVLYQEKVVWSEGLIRRLKDRGIDINLKLIQH